MPVHGSPRLRPGTDGIRSSARASPGCVPFAVVNSATWLTNLPARNSFTRPFILSHAALVAATAAYSCAAVSRHPSRVHADVVSAGRVGTLRAGFIIAGLCRWTAIAGMAGCRAGEPLWMGWHLRRRVFVGWPVT